jgi:hypothetical protein
MSTVITIHHVNDNKDYKDNENDTDDVDNDN